METSITRPILNEIEQKRRDEVEARIKDGLHGAWLGLRDMRNEKLWRSTHDSFELYCQSVWGYGKGQGYHTAQAGDVVAGLLEAGATILPTKERQARELVMLSSEEAKMVLEVVKQSSPTGKITAAHLKQVASTVKEIMLTGAVSDGNGDQMPLLSPLVKSGIVAETAERMYRQWDRIKANDEKKGLQYQGEVELGRSGSGIFNMFQFWRTLDQRFSYVVKFFRKGDSHESS